jgi:hypothetical protein
MSRGARRAPRRLAVAAAALLAGALLLVAAASAQAGFKPKPSGAVPETKLFDLGVVDFDRDGRLDVFAINHTLPGAVLRNRGGWRWRDRLGQLGLSPTRAFPGMEAMFDPPPRFNKGTGLYAYLQRDTLKTPEVKKTKIQLRAVGTRVSGRVVFDPKRPYSAPTARGGRIEDTTRPDGSIVFDFSLAPGGEATIPASVLNFPVPVQTDLAAPHGLFMGSRALRAPGRSAAFELADRHGWAFADLNRDGRDDMLDVVGGMGALIDRPIYRGTVFDRVYLQEPSGRFAISPIKLDKDNCRGRDAAILDINADGRLDMFTSCEEDVAVAYIGQADGSWKREPIPGSRGAAYRWMQLDRDRRPELVVADRSVRVIARKDAGWRTLSRTPLRPWAPQRLSFEDPLVQDLAIGDFDGDGDADIFAASRKGNSLLVNRGGKLRAVKPQRRGLPGASGGASWVDTRNRGRLDLHTLPDGLYRAKGKRFKRTGRLGAKRAYVNAISNWADFDNDGRRDALFAHAAGRFAGKHEVKLRRNTGPSGRWLQVETPGGQLASEIVVRSKRLRRVGWSGESEGSHYSQGHPRTYFGLGKRAGKRAKVTVRWTSGGKTSKRVRTNRIVRLAP